MQFKHPELLYALFLLLIPVIVHLFQLRKFKKETFTNVDFLKNVVIQTRKSAQLKKWLTLFTRLFLLAAIILAFAQPYISKNKNYKTTTDTVVYLDNSFSMQAKGDQGELLKRAVQELITHIPANKEITLFTNNKTFKKATVSSIKNELLQIGYTGKKQSYNTTLLKGKTFFSKTKNTKKHFVLISDFQNNNTIPNISADSAFTTHFVKLKPVNTNNIAIDSAYISKKTAKNITLTVILKNSGDAVENTSVSLYNKTALIAKTAVSINGTAKTTFTLPSNKLIDGSIRVEDSSLAFDNTLFFNTNTTSKINVLSIENEPHSFLKRIYTNDEFNYQSSKSNLLNYSLIDKQNVIVLNHLESIPNALANALSHFTKQGGQLIVIPSSKALPSSYNTLLATNNISISPLAKNEKRVTSINYAHPLFNAGVFEKKVTNFQYPKVNTYFNIEGSGFTKALEYEGGLPFLIEKNNVYLFTSSITKTNSNFTNSPLIVPTFYNIAKNSLKLPVLYYNIGQNNRFDINTNLQQDAVLKLVNGGINIIPKQQYLNNKVSINTLDVPNTPGIYAVKNKDSTLKKVSFNNTRLESHLTYNTLNDIKNVKISNSISKIFDTIKSDSKVNALWKWFVIFALVLLIVEMLILKYFK